MSFARTAQRAVDFLTRNNDLTMAAFLVAIIGLMIIPMPTPVVDTLLGMNMGISFIVLMMSMYVGTALDFSVFPTILLFTTLFRLSLNITTTRLILLQADAGQIIDTFGNFVVAGNFVVGAVIFLIITIVQFLVIAKGSEARWPRWARASPWTPCPASRCPSTPTCAPGPSTRPRPSAAATA